MKESKFNKISDKIFTVVTCAVVIMFVLTLLIYVWPCYGRPPELIFKFNRVFFSEQVIWAFVGITIPAQLLFIASHVKRYKGNPGGKFLIAVLLLNLVLEASMVWLLIRLDLDFLLFFWVPPVFILAELTQKDFRKGTDKIFTAVTWIMVAGLVLWVIAIIEGQIAEKLRFSSVLYDFLDYFSVNNVFVVCVLSAGIAVSQILFMLVHLVELKSKEGRKILIALILNTLLVLLPIPLYVYFPLNVFYLCAAPLLLYVKTAGKKFFKTTA